MSGGQWVQIDGGMVAWRTDEYLAAQQESRRRREQMAAIRVVHSYRALGTSLIDGTVGLVRAGCGCGWEWEQPLLPEVAHAMWRSHIASLDAARTWQSTP